MPRADGSVAAAVLVADGTSDACRVAADGATSALTAARNVILEPSPARGAIEWIRRDRASCRLSAIPYRRRITMVARLDEASAGRPGSA